MLVEMDRLVRRLIVLVRSWGLEVGAHSLWFWIAQAGPDGGGDLLVGRVRLPAAPIAIAAARRVTILDPKMQIVSTDE